MNETVDALVGEMMRSLGRLQKPRLFVMDMPGFQEVFPNAQPMDLGDGLTCKVCSLEGIVLLKLIANNDNPGRTKDITDIEHIIKVYFELYDMEIYAGYLDTMDLYEVDAVHYLELISSRVIGRRIGHLLHSSPGLWERIRGILQKKDTPAWQAMGEGLKDVPPSH